MKINKNMSLFTDIKNDVSNRRKHFIGGFLCSLIFTILFTAGAASGMEFKDYSKGGIWDWRDWICTILGGTLGLLLQIFFIWVII